MVDAVDGIKDVRSVVETLKNAFPPWEKQDYKNFVECLKRMLEKPLLSDTEKIEILSYLEPTNIEITTHVH